MEGSVFCKIVRDQPTVPRARAQFWLSFEPKWIDFGQKLKFLAYFEIRDGKIWENDPQDQKNTKIEVSPYQVYVKTYGSQIRLHSS